MGIFWTSLDSSENLQGYSVFILLSIYLLKAMKFGVNIDLECQSLYYTQQYVHKIPEMHAASMSTY